MSPDVRSSASADPGSRLAGGRSEQVDRATRRDGPDEIDDRVEAGHGEERDLELEHGALGASESERPAQGGDVPARGGRGPGRSARGDPGMPGGAPRGPRLERGRGALRVPRRPCRERGAEPAVRRRDRVAVVILGRAQAGRRRAG